MVVHLLLLLCNVQSEGALLWRVSGESKATCCHLVDSRKLVWQGQSWVEKYSGQVIKRPNKVVKCHVTKVLSVFCKPDTCLIVVFSGSKHWNFLSFIILILPPAGGLRYSLWRLHIRKNINKIHDRRHLAQGVTEGVGPGPLQRCHHGWGSWTLPEYWCAVRPATWGL